MTNTPNPAAKIPRKGPVMERTFVSEIGEEADDADRQDEFQRDSLYRYSRGICMQPGLRFYVSR